MENVVPLSEEEIQKELKTVPGWTYKDNKISKQFKFDDFMDAIHFIDKAAMFFEAEDHHPDMTINYSKVLFELQRYDIGGKVTNKDFIIARKLEELFKEKNW